MSVRSKTCIKKCMVGSFERAKVFNCTCIFVFVSLLYVFSIMFWVVCNHFGETIFDEIRFYVNNIIGLDFNKVNHMRHVINL